MSHSVGNRHLIVKMTGRFFVFISETGEKVIKISALGVIFILTEEYSSL